MKENSIDSLVFDTLIPKPIIQRYLNLLMEHRRIILSGPSGTGKSFMAAKLAEYIISQMGQEVTEHNVASFNVDQNSSKVGSRRIQYLVYFYWLTFVCLFVSCDGKKAVFHQDKEHLLVVELEVVLDQSLTASLVEV